MPSTPESEVSQLRRPPNLGAAEQTAQPSLLPEAESRSAPERQVDSYILYIMRNPLLISEPERSARATQICIEHVAKWAKEPVETSIFAQRTRWLRHVPIPDRLLVKALRAMRYDGLMFIGADGVIAHVFFQRHPNELRMFSVAVAEPFQGHGLAERALEQFVQYAKGCPGVESLRFGANGHDAVRHICRKFHARQEALGLELDPDTGIARIVRRGNSE
ncbi:MAG: GNAT family N-acetyltransferase [Oligoflexia bacterium]|nr:GNAT family N-acetyltransferase [Oligoflexia bacterium]